MMICYCRSVIMSLVMATTTFAATPAEVAHEIDQQLHDAWKEHGLNPTETVDDHAFLRRVTLDLTGRLPTETEIHTFVESSSPKKRQDAIERLLQSNAYADRWSEYWYNILIGRLTREAFLDRNAFRDWLKSQLLENQPWSKIATELVSSEGYNSHQAPLGAQSDPADWDERFHPATNYFLRYYRSLPDFSGSIAKNLLGVRIQCAQCHNHHTEKWTQEEFGQFTALFVKTSPRYYDKSLVVGTHRVDTKDRFVAPPTTGEYEKYFASYAAYTNKTPKLLDGKELGRFENRRKTFAAWMTSNDNPWFAKAFVNRAWKNLTGRGFVEPIDDFRPSNPAILPETLETLVNDFIEHEFDIRRLLTVIALTDPYQRECCATNIASTQHPLWSTYPVKPLEIETFYDVVAQATGSEEYLKRLSSGNAMAFRNAFIRQFVVDMGTDENTESDDFGDTVPRALMQWNGALINGLSRNLPGLSLESVLSDASADDRIDSLYLKTLSRDPTLDERIAWKAFLASRKNIARSEAPPSSIPTGIAARSMSVAVMDAKPDDDLRELLMEAKTGEDFKALRKRIQNNADAALYVKAFEAWAAEAPFQSLSNLGGGTTAETQAYEDMFWALLSCSEFLTNH